MSDGEVEPAIPHLPDVDDRRSCDTRRGGSPRIEQQVVGRAAVDVENDVERAVEERDIGADVGRLVLFPLQIRVTQRRLSESGNYARIGAGDVIESVAAVAAKCRRNAAGRNVLIAGNTPAVSEHHVGEDSVVRQEWLVRNAPAKTDRREGSPLMAGSEVGRAVFSEGKARNVFV